MDEYDSPESRRILTDALQRIHHIAGSNIQATPDTQREAFSEISDIIADARKSYQLEIGKIQKAELDELRRRAAAMKASEAR